MGKLSENIDSFNRKERYFLFSYATGNSDRGLKLSDAFLKDLGEALGLTVPEDARGYIDYHLDWLHAAVVLADGRASEDGPWPNKDDVETGTWKVATGNQEDIDLLVVYEVEDVTWVLLVEAKGESSWTNKQLQSKEKRLAKIFGPGAIADGAKIQPRFCLMSPVESTLLLSGDANGWPKWMLRPPCALPGKGDIAWLPLKMAEERRQVMRCDEKGRRKESEYWTHRAVKNLTS
jgi:hypothetical protein